MFHKKLPYLRQVWMTEHRICLVFPHPEKNQLYYKRLKTRFQ